jgi:hypothetical protein
MRIHRWVYDLEGWRERQSLQGGKTNPDDEVSRETYDRTGAFMMGRRMFDEGEVGWPDPPPFRAPSSSSPTAPGNRGSGREGPPSRSSPTALRASWSKRGRPRVRRTSWYPAARTRSGSSWRPAARRAADPPCPRAARRGSPVVRGDRPRKRRAGAHAGDRLAQGHAPEVPRGQVTHARLRAIHPTSYSDSQCS